MRRATLMNGFRDRGRASNGATKLLNEILRVIQDLFNYPYCAILLVDETGQQLYVQASKGYRKQVRGNFRIAIGKEGVTGWVAGQQKALFVPDVRRDPRYITGIRGGRSEVAVPLLIGTRLVGVLDVESREPRAFSQRDLRILTVFADQAAIAIHNTHLYDVERKKSAQLKLINEVTRRIAASLDADRLLPQLAKSIQETFDYYHVMILLRDDSQHVVMKAQAGRRSSLTPRGYRRRIGEGIIGLVAKHGDSILSNNVLEDSRYARVRSRTKAELCVAIRVDGVVVGVINVESNQVGAFDSVDREILENIADQLANVMRNSAVYEECKRAKDYLQKLIESSSDAITTADNRGRLIFWSKGAEEIFGYKASEVLGKSATPFYSKGKEEARRIMNQLLRAGRVKNLEVEYLGKNGRKVFASLSASLLKDEHGEIAGSLGIIRDTTEYRVLGQQLLQSERLATIGRLSTQIAHELMNPLSSIKMNIRILSKRHGLSSNDQRRLQIANFEIDHLQKILSDIFDYSRALQLNLSREPINEVLDKALLMVQDRLEQKRIVLTKRYDRKISPVTLDLVRMMQVFTNLALNAIQAVQSGGRLRVSTIVDRRLRRVTITFADNGSGIAAAQRSSIFEPFYTTKSDGTGLGLTIVKKIIEQHQGRIEVRSKVGAYTQFRIVLPLEFRKIVPVGGVASSEPSTA